MIKVACKNGLLPILTSLFNSYLKLGRFPRAWKFGVIRALLKSSEKDPKVKSYRSVCLLPILGKILERLIKYRLNEMNSMKSHEQQYGFTKGKSTSDFEG